MHGISHFSSTWNLCYCKKIEDEKRRIRGLFATYFSKWKIIIIIIIILRSVIKKYGKVVVNRICGWKWFLGYIYIYYHGVGQVWELRGSPLSPTPKTILHVKLRAGMMSPRSLIIWFYGVGAGGGVNLWCFHWLSM